MKESSLFKNIKNDAPASLIGPDTFRLQIFNGTGGCGIEPACTRARRSTRTKSGRAAPEGPIYSLS